MDSFTFFTSKGPADCQIQIDFGIKQFVKFSLGLFLFCGNFNVINNFLQLLKFLFAGPNLSGQLFEMV